MANKITLDTITSSFASTSLFNTNFAAIKSELDDKVLYRDNPTGEANQMLNDLDMNSNDILNAAEIDTDRLRLNGSLVTFGANAIENTFQETEFTNVAGETVFTVSYTPGFIVVLINGVELGEGDFTATNGSSVTLTEAVIDANDIVKVRAFGAFNVADALAVSNNLSDLQDASIARTNLGLGDVLTDITAIETQQAQGQNYGKNLIINGDFSVWQRGTSSTTFGYAADDRWFTAGNGNTVNFSRQSFTLGQTDVPNNPEYYSRTIVTSVAGAGNFTSKYQVLENVIKTAGSEVTLSFWAKADSSKNMAVEFFQSFGTGGSPSALVSSIGVQTIALTTAWTEYTITLTLPSITGKTLGTNGNDGLGVDFWFDAGSDFNARTNSLGQQSGTFDIANVQLEFGDTATEFERVSPADQLARCQRYYQKSYAQDTAPGTLTLVGSQAVTFNTTTARPYFQLPVTMRAIPAITAYSSATGASGKVHDITAAADANATVNNPSESSFYLTAAITAGNTVVAHFVADAEL